MRLRGDNLTWREIDGDLVILDLRSSTYLTANASATLLMKQLIEERSAGELVHSLVTAFGIRQQQAEHDVQAFLDDLEGSDLLETA
ncbi:PqqD family protein [Nocardioides sp. YIM 152315]|uniref:PqqD family protein n=1 Tax=Nocardioides sp. YIM 152315 TaxID=3031760 RepID=UPI0023DBF857|nr:PqqD family protein [Nocardioides sp. YIM 152315]MDF1603436.1 PqqD family protein [Nocardioides sp. YIM 152315]